MPVLNQYLGEILALLCAVVWALAVVFFKKSGESVHPLALNLFKNLLAFLLFIPTFALFGESLFRSVPFNEYAIIFLSGVLGLGAGDTLFFASLNRIGAGLNSIVSCMYSPFIITLAVVFLREKLTLLQAAGAVLIVLAVLVATLEKGKGKVRAKDVTVGIILGILSTSATAAGVIVIKPLLERSPLLWITEVRLAAGIISLLVIFVLYPSRLSLFSGFRNVRNWGYPVAGAFLGAYIAMLIWLGGMKYTKASIASALNQTSTLFVFIFAALILKEKMSIRRIIGIVFAFAGVLLVSLR
jgi:drug/metabolite transporter (DMT)-like permease